MVSTGFDYPLFYFDVWLQWDRITFNVTLDCYACPNTAIIHLWPFLHGITTLDHYWVNCSITSVNLLSWLSQLYFTGFFKVIHGDRFFKVALSTPYTVSSPATHVLLWSGVNTWMAGNETTHYAYRHVEKQLNDIMYSIGYGIVFNP